MSRVKLSPITIHPETDKVIRRIKKERAVSTGQAVDIVLLDLQAAQRRVKELETRINER